jgi:hypothetical protein
MQRLDKLREMRLLGQAPVGNVMVVTQRERLEQFEEMRLATIEVWPGIVSRLNWAGVAGLHVTAVVHWRDQAQRLQLFEAIREGEPQRLHWVYSPPDPPNRNGVTYLRNEASSVILEDGQLWTPAFPKMWRNYGRV